MSTANKAYEPHEDAQKLHRGDVKTHYEFSHIKARMVEWARATIRKWLFDRFLPMHSDIDWTSEKTSVHAFSDAAGPLARASICLIDDIHAAAESATAPNAPPDDLIVAASILGTLRKENRLISEPDATIFQLAACMERKSDPSMPRSMTDNDEVFEPILEGVVALPHMMDPSISSASLELAEQNDAAKVKPEAIMEFRRLCTVAGKVWSEENYTNYPGVEGIVKDVIDMIMKSECNVELVASCPVCHVQTVVLEYAPEPVREKIMATFQCCKCQHCGCFFNSFHPSIRLEPSERVMRVAKLCRMPKEED